MNKKQNSGKRLLNLACGAKISLVGNWTNVDFSSPLDNVTEMNILKGLPFQEDYFDVVYTAQFIEHLTLDEAAIVLKEVYRVLKPGGILRIVTPDMEELTNSYLQYLEKLKNHHNVDDEMQYDWIRIELFDQIVRDCSGGEMVQVIESRNDKLNSFLLKRLGYSYSTMVKPKQLMQKYTYRTGLSKVLKKIYRAGLSKVLKKIYNKTIWFALGLLAPNVVKIGRYRKSGEVHRYIHDIYSLSRLLRQANFETIMHMDPYKSTIPNWEKYELDVIQGQPDGPLSLYLEVIK